MATWASRNLAVVILNGAPPLRPRARAAAMPAWGAFDDQRTLKLGQRPEDAEYQLAGCRSGIDCRALAGQHLEPDTTGGEVVHQVDQMAQVAAEAIELPHYQGVALAHGLDAGEQTRSIVPASGSEVLVKMPLRDRGAEQGARCRSSTWDPSDLETRM